MKPIGILLLSGLFLLPLGNQTGQANDFPSRPVEIIIGFAPGGTQDIAVRAMSDELSKNLGVPVIATNKGGAGGVIAVEYVASAKPDGYTILIASNGQFNILPLLTPGIHYKHSDFVTLCKYFTSPNLVVVRKASPYKTFKDIISDAKRNPAKLTCATPGFGTPGHFALEMIKIQAGIDIGHLPYKSGGEVNTSLLGGQVDFANQGLPPAMGLLKSGDLRGLATITFERLQSFPDIPTMKELDYPKAILDVWFAFFLPKGTPKPVIDKLASVFEKTINSPGVKTSMESQGNVVGYQEGSTFSKFITEESKMLEEVAKQAKLIK